MMQMSFMFYPMSMSTLCGQTLIALQRESDRNAIQLTYIEENRFDRTRECRLMLFQPVLLFHEAEL